MITSKELAKLAGVSQSTVSRALNDSPLISDDVKSEIKKLAKEYRFEMNSQAKSLRTKRTDTIGILFPRFFMNLSTNLYFTYLYDSLQVELSKYDYDLLVVYDSKNQAQLSPLEKMIRRKKVDGFILVRPDLQPEEKEMLDSSDLPYVSIFSKNSDDEGTAKYTIKTYDGGVLAGGFLAMHKEYSPLYFGSHFDTIDSSNRMNGFATGWSNGGRDASQIQTITCDMSIPNAYQTVIQQVKLFSEKRVVYVYNDMIACGMLMALKDLSIRVPEQVQLISNDDIPLASWMTPQLSTLRFPTKQLIESACQRLVREIVSGKLENENLQLSPELVLRGTTLEIIS
jgi:DNA-binding LacI/PurR family transcriptional regulator